MAAAVREGVSGYQHSDLPGIGRRIDRLRSIFRENHRVGRGGFCMKKINIKLTLTDKTALAITKYADRWGMTPGEVVDSLMRFYKREMRKRYNHE